MKRYVEERCRTGSTRWGFIQQKSAVLRQGEFREGRKMYLWRKQRSVWKKRRHSKRHYYEVTKFCHILLNHSLRLATNPKIYQIIQHSFGDVRNNIWDFNTKSLPRPHCHFRCCWHKRQRALPAMTMSFEAYAREGHNMVTRLEVLRFTRFLWARKVSRSSYSKTSDGTWHGRLGNCCNISVGKPWTIPATVRIWHSATFIYFPP